MTPAARPTTTAPQVETTPQAGVIATSPATTPDAAPNEVGCPSRIRSTASQPSIPIPPATSVFNRTAAALPSAASAEPELKPNQPNHSRPAPVSTNGRLCGRIDSTLKPCRVPNTRARARAEAPEV